MEKVINQALTDKFLNLMKENALGNSRLDALACLTQQELTRTLSEDQLELFHEMDSALSDADTVRMEQVFRLGFLEGLKVGRSVFS